jgi:hypothetical protein
MSLQMANNRLRLNRDSQDHLQIKYDYAAWIEQVLDGNNDDVLIWVGYIVTFMFNHISGNEDHKYKVMEDAIDRVYGTLARHVVRDPRSKSERKKLPRLYAFPDYPQKRLEPFDRKDITVNDGLHYHGIVLIPTETRLKTTLPLFLKRNREHFVKADGPIRRIHIEPIDRTPSNAVGYAFKAIEYRIPDSNRMLILPKALSELPHKPKHRSSI